MPKLQTVIPDFTDVVTATEADRLRKAQLRFDQLESTISENSFDATKTAIRESHESAVTSAARNSGRVGELPPAQWLQDQAATQRKAAKVAQAEVARQITPVVNKVLRKMAERVSQRVKDLIEEEQVLWEPFGMEYRPSDLVLALDALGQKLVEQSETEIRHRSAAAPAKAFGLFGADLWAEIQRDLFPEDHVTNPDPEPEALAGIPTDDTDAEDVLSGQ